MTAAPVVAPVGGVVAVQPTGPLFDVVLLLHIAAVLASLFTVTASALSAVRLLAAGGDRVPPAVRSYFSPGVNWAGRVLYAVPVFGFLLIGLSSGAYHAGEGWIVGGLVLWAVGALLAEGLLWPAERRVQAALAAVPGDGGSVPAPARRACLTMCLAAGGVFAVLVAATVVMVAQP